MTMPGTWENPSFTADLNDAGKPPVKRTIAGAGPVPKWAGGMVLGALLGLSVLRRSFRGA